MKNKPLFYGWWIVASCFMLMFVVMAIVSMVMGVFAIPVSESLGITRTEFSLYFTILSGVGLLVSPAIGRSRMDLRIMTSLGVIICGGCFIALSYCNGLIMFYAVSVLMGIGFKICTNIPASILLSNWFKEKSGTAVGLSFAGAGIGSMIFTPLASEMITAWGWRTAYLVLGIAMMALTLPFTLLVIRNRPEEKGLRAYGADTAFAGKAAGVHFLSGPTLKELMKTPFFWVIMVCMVVVNMVANGVNSQLPSYMQDIGHSAAFAAFVVSCGALMLTAGKVSLGYLSDKMGGGTMVALSCIALAAALFALLGAGASGIAVAAGMLHGFGTSFGSVGPPIITKELFGDRDYGNIMAVVTMTSGIGMALGAPFCGFIYDGTGSYMLAWIIFAAAMVLVTAVFLYALKIHKTKLEATPEPVKI